MRDDLHRPPELNFDLDDPDLVGFEHSLPILFETGTETEATQPPDTDYPGPAPEPPPPGGSILHLDERPFEPRGQSSERKLGLDI